MKDPTTLRDAEIQAIKYALEFTGGNKTKAAHWLGCSLRKLRIWISKEPELRRWYLGEVPPALRKKREMMARRYIDE